jgi:hypothetical protein
LQYTRAAHAVAAHALGVTVRQVSVRSTFTWDGWIEHAECAPEDELRILVAGEVAEQRAQSQGVLVAPQRSRRSRRKEARKQYVSRVQATSVGLDDEDIEHDHARINFLLEELSSDPELQRDLYVAVVSETYQLIAARWMMCCASPRHSSRSSR